jgi:hypothetical protein
MSILNTIASRAFPEGNLQSIKANAPNQMSYNIDATRDLVQNQPFNPLAPGLAFGLSLPYDTLQGIGRAFQDVKSEPGILDYDNIPNDITFADIGKSIAAENPIDSLIGRTYGATLGLGDKLTGYGKSLADMFGSNAMAEESMVNVDNVKSAINAARNREALNRQGLMALDDAGLTMSPYEEFAQVAKPGFNFNRAGNFLTNVKDKGMNFLGSSKDLALRGIGSIIGGPVGGFIGGALGNLTNQFENRPLGANVIDEFGNVYDFNDLNKQNALGGYYTEAARSGRRRSARIARMLERQKLGKKYSLSLLAKLQAQEKAQEALQQAAANRLQDQNRAAGTGGYQAGYDSGFMEGPSGAGTGMGSADKGGSDTMGSS